MASVYSNIVTGFGERAPRRGALALVLTLIAATPCAAQDVPYVRLDPAAFQSFVRNWEPSSRPLCAALQSKADWNAVMAPAPVMGAAHPFAPPDDLWARSTVLMLARVVDAGDTAEIFKLRGVRQADGRLDISYSFAPPPKASSRMKWWLGITVAKPLPPIIRFLMGDVVTCTLAPASGKWRTNGTTASPAPG
jgi:hypothetical protein